MRNIVWAGVAVAVLAMGVRAEEPKPAGKGDKSATLDKVKKLVGTWVAEDDKGQPTETVVSVFKVTAAGSAVTETIFPGQPHEMVSVYHMDGKDAVMTHYCAMGNQPKMKIEPADKELKFVFAGGSNLDPAKDMHMHEGSIKWTDEDHIVWSWQGYMDGKPAKEHVVSMKLVRKKK